MMLNKIKLPSSEELVDIEDSHFKRPFGVEGEVSNGRPIKLGFLIAGLG